MLFIETTVFTRQVRVLLDDEQARCQWQLAQDPHAGDVIADTGGLRKLRVAVSGRGKRGGARIIYYHVGHDAQIRLLLIYAKGVKDDLTPAEKKVLRTLNEDW